MVSEMVTEYTRVIPIHKVPKFDAFVYCYKRWISRTHSRRRIPLIRVSKLILEGVTWGKMCSAARAPRSLRRGGLPPPPRGSLNHYIALDRESVRRLDAGGT